MIIRLQIVLVLAAAVALSGCNPGISGDSQEASAGNADFSKFVALGDSLSAGYRDGALFRAGQMISFPAIMAQQFEQVGGGSYSQPLMPVGATGSLTFMGMPIDGRIDRLVLTGDPLGIGTVTPTQSTAIETTIPGPYNDMAVPGARFYHLPAATYGDITKLPDASPYFIRSASSAAASMLGDTLSQAPTFFVLWIGGNDLLDYAADGGTGIDQTGISTDPTTYGPKDITDPEYFASGGTGMAMGAPSYSDVVAALTMSGAKGVIVNIPDIQTIPYFTVVPYNAIPLEAADAASLNAQVADNYNAAVDFVLGINVIDEAEANRRRITYVEGQNPIIISDDTLFDLSGSLGPLAGLGQARPATADDFILLPAASKLGEEDTPGNPLSKWGVTLPLEDGDVLTDTEAAAVEAAQQAINATIKGVADASSDLAFYDAAARLKELNDSGIDYGSGRISSDFPTGGGFSLDGIHPTARTSAVIANDLFSLINSTFDAFIPGVDPNDYASVPVQ